MPFLYYRKTTYEVLIGEEVYPMKVEITHDFNYVTKLKVDYSDVCSIGS